MDGTRIELHANMSCVLAICFQDAFVCMSAIGFRKGHSSICAECWCGGVKEV